MGDVGRDPRTDPRPGDELKLGRRGCIGVVERTGEMVSYREGKWGGVMKLNYWLTLTKSATVVKKGEPE